MTETAQTTNTDDGIESDALAMLSLMISIENAEIVEMPVTGPVIAFPSIL